ncbi:MAG: AAA family ATPase [Oscillospiraceae bacterium]|nr:AAA family ATPase [Oscillospiraceae bacterium]
MAKPRIILADPEVEYISRLQLIFIEEFFEKIDLEIITDRDYFEELFASPQKADILVVSDELYFSTLQMHDISDIFVMTESQEDDTAELKVNYLNKYTDKKNIINEIVGNSKALSEINGTVQKDSEIILVYSASGGSGKSTIARGIAAALTKSYKKVLYISADRLHTFQRMLANPSPIPSSDVYGKLTAPGKNIYSEIKHIIRTEDFAYIPPFKASLMSLGINYDVYEKIAVSAKKSKEYDYIVVDADVCFDNDKAMLISSADKVLIVTTQDESSVYSTNVVVSNINGINSEKYMFICNRFDKEASNALLSPEFKLRFSVTDYVKTIYNCDKMPSAELAKERDMQRLALLIM